MYAWFLFSIHWCVLVKIRQVPVNVFSFVSLEILPIDFASFLIQSCFSHTYRFWLNIYLYKRKIWLPDFFVSWMVPLSTLGQNDFNSETRTIPRYGTSIHYCDRLPTAKMAFIWKLKKKKKTNSISRQEIIRSIVPIEKL